MTASTAEFKKNVTKPLLQNALQESLIIAAQAGRFLKSKYGKFTDLDEKPGAGLVTEADKGSEAMIYKYLQKKFPSFSWLGEETGTIDTGSSGFRWVVDPLDGTTNFVHGFPMFCVSIGLEFQGTPICGVVHNPMSRDTYWAHLGGGAFKNDRPIHVSKIKHLKDAMLTTGFSYRENAIKSEVKTFSRMVHISRAIRRTGSAALDLCITASGQFDGFFERGLASWDVTAGLTILKEAGGQYSDFKGGKYQLGGPEIIASNGKIHRVLIREISR